MTPPVTPAHNAAPDPGGQDPDPFDEAYLGDDRGRRDGPPHAADLTAESREREGRMKRVIDCAPSTFGAACGALAALRRGDDATARRLLEAAVSRVGGTPAFGRAERVDDSGPDADRRVYRLSTPYIGCCGNATDRLVVTHCPNGRRDPHVTVMAWWPTGHDPLDHTTRLPRVCLPGEHYTAASALMALGYQVAGEGGAA